MPARKTFRVSHPAPPSKNKRNRKQNWNRGLSKTRHRGAPSPLLKLFLFAIILLGWLAVVTGQVPALPGPKVPQPSGQISVASNNKPAVTPARVTPGQPLTATVPALPPTPTKAPTTLEEAVSQVIAKDKTSLGEDAEFGLLIHNLDTGERLAINSDDLFESASLYKLFVMLTVFYDISGGRMSLDDQITLIPDANAANEDGYTIVTPGNSLAVRELLEHMIIDSNNTASLMLLFQVRSTRMKDIVAALGFTGSDFSDTWNFKVTAQDLDLFFSRLADLKLLGPKYDQLMLDLLSRSQPRDRIPALLPPGTNIANKTGNLEGIINDAGIVYLPNGNRLLISVLTHYVNDVAARQFIAELSLSVYNFYNLGKT